MKEHLIIRTHSFIDLITNSSTEMFVINGSYELDFVKKVIEEKFPKLMKYLDIYFDEDEYVKEFNAYSKEYALECLRKTGYTIIEPSTNYVPMAIHICSEQGMMTNKFIKFIKETFNGDYNA